MMDKQHTDEVDVILSSLKEIDERWKILLKRALAIQDGLKNKPEDLDEEGLAESLQQVQQMSDDVHLRSRLLRRLRDLRPDLLAEFSPLSNTEDDGRGC